MRIAERHKEFLWQKQTLHRAAALEAEHALEMAREIAVMLRWIPG